MRRTGRCLGIMGSTQTDGERALLVPPSSEDAPPSSSAAAAAAAAAEGFAGRAVGRSVAAVMVMLACAVFAAHARRGGGLRAFGGSPRLGDGVTLGCPKGVLEPASRGPNEDFTPLTFRISGYADKVYIICTDECDMTVPEELGDEVMMLNGRELDKCNSVEGDHWYKASQTHLVALTHAMATNAGNALILEQDAMTDKHCRWEEAHYAELDRVLGTREWNLLRLDYRPLFFELDRKLEACPVDCRCEKVGEKLCWIERTGCDLRSAAAYLVNRRAMERLAATLREGITIDAGALQRIPNQVLITPQVNYQLTGESDYVSVQQQKEVSKIFRERCHLGLTATQARERFGKSAALGSSYR